MRSRATEKIGRRGQTGSTDIAKPRRAGVPAAGAWVVAVLAMVIATPASAAPDEAVPESNDLAWVTQGPTYTVARFEVRYDVEHPAQPELAQLTALPMQLGLVEGRYVAPRPGVPAVDFRLADVDDGEVHQFHYTAVKAINDQILAFFNRLGLIGVIVAPDPEDIDEDGEDLRAPAGGTLHLVIRLGVVDRIRSLASGSRIPVGQRADHRAHRRIRQQSPVQADAPASLLRKDLLDEYLFSLNRHPGRRVDVAISAGDQPGQLALDFLVTENKPWVAYLQTSNTGTKQTSEWRHRLGVVHNQLTSNDDMLSLEYVTAGFDESHAVIGSYEAPLLDSDFLRWRVFGSWGEFTASDVGSADESFKGDEQSVGGELSATLFQRGELFVDAIVGVRWWNVHVENMAVVQEGEQDFVLPRIGLELERQTETATTMASLSFEGNVANVDQTELDSLGRFEADDNWVVLKWDAAQSFYLEPLLNRAGWQDPATPRSSTLAHEIALSIKGQTALGNRLIPQTEQTVGGFYTVRGYDESLAAGDTVVIASAEYRCHVPRLLPLEPDPSRTALFGKPFRFAPQRAYGRPDWDMILRAFVDAGRSLKTDRESFEFNETLVGTGVGVELVYKTNLNVRVDWAVALHDAGADGAGGFDAQEGSNRFHIAATILY